MQQCFSSDMQKLFTKILVPVNFNRNTSWAVDKSIQLANKFNCDILLLNVQPVSSFYNLFFSDHYTETSINAAVIKMKKLEQQHRSKLKEGSLMTSAVLAGNWQSVLKDVIIAEHIDLTIIPRGNSKLNNVVIRHININKLSQQTNCPVMTMTRNFNANHLQNIVVPVHDLLPVKKLTIATYLSLETNARIYLVGGDDQATGKMDGYLMKAYQLLNELGKLNIQCALGNNDHTATETLAYAKEIKANLIVVNPGQESRLKGWWNQLRGKYLCRESDIPVLTVAL